jgi:urea transport system permease protein
LAAADVVRQLQRQIRQVRRRTQDLKIRVESLLWRVQGSALALLLILCLPAHATPDLTAFASPSFAEIERGVGALATSGDPRAADILAALQAGKLVLGGGRQLYIRTDAGVVSAATGLPADAPDARPVRVNNSVRQAVASAVGMLRLFSADPTQRASAAEAVFHARDASALPALDRALATESVPGVKRTMQEARAAAILAASDSSEPDRLAAIATLAARGDMEARSLIGAIPAPSPAVAAAADSAVASIDRWQRVWGVLQGAFYGVSLGSVLLLAAAGLAITFGVMGVINMAHGEMVMLGAYTTFMVQEAIRSAAPGLFGISLFIAVPAAFLVSGAVGVSIERLLIRYLYGRPLETLLATWGLSLVLQQAVRSIFGADNRNVGTPEWMSGAYQVGGLVITTNRLTIIVFAVLVLAALMAVLRFTALGLRMRAVTQNRRMAAAMGIRTPWVDAMTFGLGSGIAGIAGVALSQIDNVSPNLGQGYIIDSFMVVVFGGVGNLWGTVLGALVLGMVNKFLEPVAGAVLGKIVVLVLLIAFIQRRPRGMFPLKGRAVEA